MLDSRGAARTNSAMKGSRPTLIGMIDSRSTLYQEVDYLSLGRRTPDAARFRPWIAGIVKRRRTTAILGVNVRSALEQQSRSIGAQACRGEMKRSVANIQPVWNRLHQIVLNCAHLRQLR